jgi:hypothetical protein
MGACDLNSKVQQWRAVSGNFYLCGAPVLGFHDFILPEPECVRLA